MHQALAGGDACPGDVGGDVTVLGGKQRVVGTGWLLRQYVYACRKDLSAVEGIGKVALVDEWPASGVDEDGGGLHQGKAAGIDQLAGGVGEGAVQADDIARGKKFVQFHLPDFRGQLGCRLGGVGADFHAEA